MLITNNFTMLPDRLLSAHPNSAALHACLCALHPAAQRAADPASNRTNVTSRCSLQIGVFWRFLLSNFPEMLDYLVSVDEEQREHFQQFIEVMYEHFFDTGSELRCQLNTVVSERCGVHMDSCVNSLEWACKHGSRENVWHWLVHIPCTNLLQLHPDPCMLLLFSHAVMLASP